MLDGPQRRSVALSFSIPSICADRIAQNKIDVGLVPVAEIARQRLEIVPGVAIACSGAVRSIILVTRVLWRNVRTLAADSSSRTSVHLARIILRDRFGVEPQVLPHPPNLEQMLTQADAALLIGDPALRLDLETIGYEWLDLGSEWLKLTGLPMVYATWAGKPQNLRPEFYDLLPQSYAYGQDHLEEIIEREFAPRGISRELASQYLRRNIRFCLDAQERRGLDAFLELSGLRENASDAEPQLMGAL